MLWVHISKWNVQITYCTVSLQTYSERKSEDVILWSVIVRSSRAFWWAGNICRKGYAQFSQAAPTTTKKAIKNIHQKYLRNGAIHFGARGKKYHQYLTLFYEEGTWFHPGTLKMTTSDQLPSTRFVCISGFSTLFCSGCFEVVSLLRSSSFLSPSKTSTVAALHHHSDVEATLAQC